MYNLQISKLHLKKLHYNWTKNDLLMQYIPVNIAFLLCGACTIFYTILNQRELCLFQFMGCFLSTSVCRQQHRKLIGVVCFHGSMCDDISPVSHVLQAQRRVYVCVCVHMWDIKHYWHFEGGDSMLFRANMTVVRGRMHSEWASTRENEHRIPCWWRY